MTRDLPSPRDVLALWPQGWAGAAAVGRIPPVRFPKPCVPTYPFRTGEESQGMAQGHARAPGPGWDPGYKRLVLLQHEHRERENANFPMLSAFYTSLFWEQGDNSSRDILLSTDVFFMDPEL